MWNKNKRCCDFLKTHLENRQSALAMCFLNKQTNKHFAPTHGSLILGSTGKCFGSRNEQCFATIYFNGPRIIFCPLNGRMFCLNSFHEYILPIKKFKFFDCFSLFCLNSTSNVLISSKPDNDALNLLFFCIRF